MLGGQRASRPLNASFNRSHHSYCLHTVMRTQLARSTARIADIPRIQKVKAFCENLVLFNQRLASKTRLRTAMDP